MEITIGQIANKAKVNASTCLLEGLEEQVFPSERWHRMALNKR